MSSLIVTAPPGTPFIVTTRVFDASRELVFKTYTDPKLIPMWWGPAYLTTVVEEMDVRRGGTWRYVQRDHEGNLYVFHGVYHQVSPPERLVYTFEWEGMPGHVLLETIDFADQDGKTLITDESVFQSVEDRDGMLAEGAEGGTQETMERFEALLRLSRSK